MLDVNCPICRLVGVIKRPGAEVTNEFVCSACGVFRLDSRAQNLVLPHLSDADRNKLSCYSRAQTVRHARDLDDGYLPPTFVDERRNSAIVHNSVVTIAEACEAFPYAISDRLDRALLNLGRATKHLGELLKIQRHVDNPLVFALNDDEFFFILGALDDAGDIRIPRRQSGAGIAAESRPTFDSLRITPPGLVRIAAIERGTTGRKLDQAFVAMWFDRSVDSAYHEGIKPAIEGAGYRCLRIDFSHSNDLLDEQILAGIRESRFMVCDLTGQRHNAYLEAGFALGLGLEVFWTCGKDWIEKTGFDVNHRPIIVWEQPEDITSKLDARIRAKFGHGPFGTDSGTPDS